MAMLHDREAFLLDYGKLGPEQYRQSKEELFGIQNSRKARDGGLKGLNDQALMARKAADEKALRAGIEADPAKKAAFAAAWDRIAATKKIAAQLLKPLQLPRARVRLRLPPLRDRPDPGPPRRREGQAERRPAPRVPRVVPASRSSRSSSPRPRPTPTSRRPSSPARSHVLAEAHEGRPAARARVLRGRSAEQAAADLVDGTRLADPKVRKALAEGGAKAIEASDDPMIKLALAVDADARGLRKKAEDQVDAVDTVQYGLIAKARFAELGESTYPDATFTLRLAFGTVKPVESGGKMIPAYTTMGGAFDHAAKHGDKEPYKLPPSPGSPRRRSGGSASTPPSTSSRRPTSSAGTPGAPWSTATTRSSA